jgi:hypothetical protein
MKLKILIFLFFIVVCNGYADSFNNPASPSIIQEGFIISDKSFMNFRLGIENDFTYDELVQFKGCFKESLFSHPKLESRTSNFNIILNIKERLDIYGKIGKSIVESRFQKSDDFFRFKCKSNPFYEAGVKLLLIEINSYAFGLDVNYFYYSSSPSFLLKNEAPQEIGLLKYSIKGWQIGVLVSKSISYFVPYFGLSVRNVDIKFDHFPFYDNKRVALHDKHREGLVLGCSFSPYSYIMLNAEVRIINQNSIACGGSFRF